MGFLIKWLMTYIRREEGATAIEYALMVALIAVAIIITVTALGGQLNAVFTYIKDALDTATP
ncbi:MAG: Flp family type IVb pilin [Actinobacteria bacterium]|nr:Flp family type IVb pilin [Actinomycetota bacterium]